MNKRILVIANNSFSKTGSNGRTLGNLFVGYGKQQVAQFFLQPECPDFDVCAHYFRATDKAVLRSFFTGKQAGDIVADAPPAAASAPVAGTPSVSKKPRKTPFTMLLRNTVWSAKRWRKSLLAFVEEFDPEVILLQAGDAPFLFDLACDLAACRHIPLMMYQSEDYYLKDYNYFGTSPRSLWYRLFQKKLHKSFERAMAQAQHIIYICDSLKQAYDQRFSQRATVIMTCTDMTPASAPPHHEPPVIRYLGNLGVGRDESLCYFAKALQKVDSRLRLEVYGKIPSEAVQQHFDGCDGLVYGGFVSYEEVVQKMHDSDLLIHVESFRSFYRRDLKYAFSTKIADCLACGVPFVLFAPEDFACAQYVKATGSAHLVTDPKQLPAALKRLLEDPVCRDSCLEAARAAVAENHRAETARGTFRRIIEQESLANGRHLQSEE